MSQCQRKGCTNPAKEPSKRQKTVPRFCSDLCRTKDWQAKNLVARVRKLKPGEVACVKCGKPAKFEEDGQSKCGNHHLARRRENAEYRKVFKELRANFSAEELREISWRAMRLRDAGGIAA